MPFKGYAEVNVTDSDRIELQVFSKYLHELTTGLSSYIESYDKEKFAVIEKGFFRTNKCYYYHEINGFFNSKLLGCNLPINVKVRGHIVCSYDSFNTYYLHIYSHLTEPLEKLKVLFEADKVYLSVDLYEAWLDIRDSDWTPMNELVEHLEDV